VAWLVAAVLVAVLLVAGLVALTQQRGNPPAPADPGTSGQAATGLAALGSVEPVVLAAPPFDATPPSAPATPSGPEPALLSRVKNAVTDTEAWFRDHGIMIPRVPAERADADVPRTYRGHDLVEVITQPEAVFLLYGDAPAPGGDPGAAPASGLAPTVLVALDPATRAPRYALDLRAYARAPRALPGDEEFVDQQIRWARQVGDVLYVSHGHWTYARSSYGANAYVTAIRVPAGEVLWHSAPLVSNALTFEVVDDHLVTGYGFTAEPDALYVLDRGSGAVTRSVALASGPEYIVRQGDLLLVRCYSDDYAFGLR
jgi:hypothetical protein